MGPFQGPLRLLASFDSGWETWARVAGCLAAGLALGAWIIYQSPVLHITAEQVEARERGAVRKIRREQVAGVHRDGNRIVMETAEGRVLFRGEVEGGRQKVREAFVSRGYPWEAE